MNSEKINYADKNASELIIEFQNLIKPNSGIIVLNCSKSSIEKEIVLRGLEILSELIIHLTKNPPDENKSETIVWTFLFYHIEKYTIKSFIAPTELKNIKPWIEWAEIILKKNKSIA